MTTKLRNIFRRTKPTAQEAFYRDWDQARASANTERERAEIDAIFSRHSADITAQN